MVINGVFFRWWLRNTRSSKRFYLNGLRRCGIVSAVYWCAVWIQQFLMCSLYTTKSTKWYMKSAHFLCLIIIHVDMNMNKYHMRPTDKQTERGKEWVQLRLDHTQLTYFVNPPSNVAVFIDFLLAISKHLKNTKIDSIFFCSVHFNGVFYWDGFFTKSICCDKNRPLAWHNNLPSAAAAAAAIYECAKMK